MFAASPSPKIHLKGPLLDWREYRRQAGSIVVHCHSCFDIVHPGHIAHLQQARALGDTVVVSGTNDANVNKGHARPLIPDDLRAASLAALECVDAVFVNDLPTVVDLLKDLVPDIYVKGKEYEHSSDPRLLAEREAVFSYGSRIVCILGDISYYSSTINKSLT